MNFRRIGSYVGLLLGATLVASLRSTDEAVVTEAAALIAVLALAGWARRLDIGLRLPAVLGAGYEFATWFFFVASDRSLYSNYYGISLEDPWLLWMVIAPIAAFAFYLGLRWAMRPH